MPEDAFTPDEPHPPTRPAVSGLSFPRVALYFEKSILPPDYPLLSSASAVKPKRLAENRFALDGETVGFSQVLKRVNDMRKAADLDPLSSLQAR